MQFPNWLKRRSKSVDRRPVREAPAVLERLEPRILLSSDWAYAQYDGSIYKDGDGDYHETATPYTGFEDNLSDSTDKTYRGWAYFYTSSSLTKVAYDRVELYPGFPR